MKKLILLSILFFSLKGYSQEGTIHVKKQEKTPGCEFKFSADSSLVNQTIQIGSVRVNGIDDNWTTLLKELCLKFAFGNKIMISKENFQKDLQDICDNKSVKLEEVIILRSLSGTALINFFFSER
jgi:hypothetical protein